MSLSKNFIVEMKEELLKEKATIEDQLKDFVDRTDEGSTAEVPQYGDHSGENASEVASYDSDLSIKATLEKTLRDIAKALDNIAQGTYGICKYCHEEIAEGRLRIRPTSSTCIKCKKKFVGES